MVLQVKSTRLLLVMIGVVSVAFLAIYYKYYYKPLVVPTASSMRLYEAGFRDNMIKMKYGLKKWLNDVEVSDELAIVAIDSKTFEKYGKFTSPTWIAKLPYDGQLRYMQRYFTPSCVSYDILFKSDGGTFFKGFEVEDINFNTPELKKLAEEIDRYADNLDGIPEEKLLKLSSLLAAQGETVFENVLNAMQLPDDEETPPVPVVLAVSMEEGDGLYSGKHNFDNKDFYKWTDKEVVGEDPDEKDESLGIISYLKQVAIPNEQIHNIPNDYVYMPKTELVPEGYMIPTSLGYINVKRDEDGITRRYSLVQATKYYNTEEKKLKTLFTPSFALISYLKHIKATTKDVTVTFGQDIKIKTKDRIISVPIDNYGRIIANFNFNVHDLPYVSFRDIREYGSWADKKGMEAITGDGRVKFDHIKNSLSGNICLVGFVHTGIDIGPTSIEENMALVYVHAAVVNSLLTGKYLVASTNFDNLLLMSLVLLLLGVGALYLTIKNLTILFILVEILAFVVSFAGVYNDWKFFPYLLLSCYILVLYIAIVLFRYFTEEKEKVKIRNMFSTMVSSSVLDYMEEHPESFSLSGSKMSATIMFSDVAGFTSISEGLTPEQLVQLLNKYLTPMTDIILESGGYVDKYEGDAIMAEWGVPFPNEKHATLACWAVLDQLKKLDEIREELYQEFGYKLTVRLGVNSGEVSAGNMGSESRFSYTVMGDAVNLAARLEPTNKVYGTLAMIGEKTYDLAKDDIDARLLDSVVVVGKKEAIRVYELIARKGEMTKEQSSVVEHYEKGLELHAERKWDEAIAEFEEALKVNPEDTASKVLIKRIQGYKENPPAEGWKGEYVRTSKD